MKIKVEHIPEGENEITLRCTHLDEEMLEVLSLLKERIVKITAQKDGAIFMIPPGKVLYVDSVDGNTFIYTEDTVYETHETLTQLEAKYENTGIIRIAKSQLVNLYHVSKLKSLPNSRIEITLKNDERLIVSRHYTNALKEKLSMEVL